MSVSRAHVRFFGLMAIATVALAACTSSGGDVATDDQPAAPAADSTTTTTEPAGAVGPAVASAGCSLDTPLAARLDERTTITSGDAERWFLVTTPSDYDGTEPLPVVVDSHGFSEGAEIHTRMSEMDGVAEANGFIAIYPNGTGEPVRWNANAGDPNNLDTAFIGDLLDTVEADLCVDTSRVYATGLSNGALLTSVLACELEDRFAAVAPVAGAMDPVGCDNTLPMPFLTIHGTYDNFIPFNGGLGSGLSLLTGGGTDPDTTTTTTVAADYRGEGIPAQVAGWAARNGCEPEPTEEQYSTDIVLQQWSCPKGADVEFYIVVGGGHAWPGSEFSAAAADIMGYTTNDIEASELMWDFFSRFQR